MCLGVPGSIIETSTGPTGLKMGRVSFSGIVRDICLEYEPDAIAGDWVIVHAGFAISRVTEDEAHRILAALEEMEQAAAAYGSG